MDNIYFGYVVDIFMYRWDLFSRRTELQLQAQALS